MQKTQTVPHNLKINSQRKVHKLQLLAHASVDEAFWQLCTALFMVADVLIKEQFNQHVDILLHMRQSHTHTMQGLFLPCFWAICYRTSTSFHAFLLVSFQLTTCIMLGGQPPQPSELGLSSLCSSCLLCCIFGFIPSSYKLKQTELFMLSRNYPL